MRFGRLAVPGMPPTGLARSAVSLHAASRLRPRPRRRQQQQDGGRVR
jgi:hypothetical protein